MSRYQFGNNLEKILKEKGIRQTTFARQLNKSDSTISQWITGTRKPGLDHILLICQTLEISADTLLQTRINPDEVSDSEEFGMSCEVDEQDQKSSHDLKHLMEHALNATGYEDNARYIVSIKNIFCFMSHHLAEKDRHQYKSLMRLFYIDFMLLVLCFSKSVSLSESSALSSKQPRNFYIGQCLVMLLPHNLNDAITMEFQFYIYHLLELQKYPDLREAIRKLYCIAAFGLTWLESDKSPDLLIESMQFSLPLVIEIIDQVLNLTTPEGEILQFDASSEKSQAYYIDKRKELKQLIQTVLY